MLEQTVADAAVPGAVAVVRDGTDIVTHTAGYADLTTGAEFTADTHLRAASITKTVVAATVLQLVGEDLIDLDAPIETYLPGRIRGEGIDGAAITVRQLLRHQSGLPEYFDDVTEPPAGPVTGEQLLDAALSRPAQFAPGAEMRYTNTNYVIAGLLIEAVTGAPAEAEITRRIIDPLGLTGTYFPEPGATGLREPFARGYAWSGDTRADVTDFNASAAGTAGGLVSTGADITAFITALFDGRIVAPELVTEMQDTVDRSGSGPETSYGLGLGRIELPCDVTAWGHGGDLPGYHSMMAKQPGGPAVSVAFTQYPDDAGSDDARTAVLEAVYCEAAA
ncbi:serine hydrolase domain-containing protein [Mycolicibacterium thermoresistibile]